MRTVYDFCETVGLPTTLADIGLADVRREDLFRAAQKVCAPEECIHHEAGEISPEKFYRPCWPQAPWARPAGPGKRKT
jgi:glycerol dehydrogenase